MTEQRLRRQQAHTEEAQLMELLADKEADEEGIPDDGELEGSGDDFEGCHRDFFPHCPHKC